MRCAWLFPRAIQQKRSYSGEFDFRAWLITTTAVETHPSRARKLRNKLFPGNKLKNGVPQIGNLLPFVHCFSSTQGKLVVSVLCPIFSTFPALHQNWLWPSLAHVTMRSRLVAVLNDHPNQVADQRFSLKVCYGHWYMRISVAVAHGMRHSTILCVVRAKLWKEMKRNQNILQRAFSWRKLHFN